jgi:uncharacterized damage-inducible protein DinB
MVNPYAKYLGDRNPFEVVAATASRLEQLLGQMGPERADKSPAPGKWSAREIVAHLADCELVFAFRLRQTIAEDHHMIQPFDQESWARSYAAYKADEALAAFTAFRQWNLLFLRPLPSSVYSKPVSHPERGQGTFQILLETMAGHDLNHIGQLEAIK